jgi:hypothetical protein
MIKSTNQCSFLDADPCTPVDPRGRGGHVDVFPDGSFLMLTNVTPPSPPRIEVVVNWAAQRGLTRQLTTDALAPDA